MEQRTNAGYLITSTVQVGAYEFVLGVNMKTPNLFVTWKCNDKQDYFWGHYTDNLQKATADLCERVLEELRDLEERGQQATFDLLGDGPMLLADIKYGDQRALIPLPTNRLSQLLRSAGITLPPDEVHLGGSAGIQIRLLHNETKEAGALARLFQEHHCLDLVNEVAKAVNRSDSRSSKQIREHLKEGRYHKVEEVLNEANRYAKALKNQNRESER